VCQPTEPVTCCECGTPLPPGRRRYCSNRCSSRASSRRKYNPASRADRYRAKGFGLRVCEMCGLEYVATWSGQRTCGRLCGGLLRRANLGQPLSLPRLHGQHSAISYGTCPVCGDWFLVSPNRLYCRACAGTSHLGGTWVRGVKVCADCGAPVSVYRGNGNYCQSCAAGRRHVAVLRYRKSVGNCHRKRARAFGVPYESIHKQAVFERDHWTCHICGRKVMRSKRFPHPRSPSIDCLVPLSVSGSPGYVYTNVACSCLRCNLVKANGCTEEQLLVVGR
jgi:hypothetical protein